MWFTEWKSTTCHVTFDKTLVWLVFSLLYRYSGQAEAQRAEVLPEGTQQGGQKWDLILLRFCFLSITLLLK